jgi:hypothetical protein
MTWFFEERFRDPSSRLRNTGIGAALCGFARVVKETVRYLGLWMLDGTVVIDWADLKESVIVAVLFGAVVGAFWRVKKPKPAELGQAVVSAQPIAPE